MTEFDGFEVLEQAALQMIGVEDEKQILNLYREALARIMTARLGDKRAAAVLADRLVDIIALRRTEIALSSSNTSEALQ